MMYKGKVCERSVMCRCEDFRSVLKRMMIFFSLLKLPLSTVYNIDCTT